jgi:hypothetical protein
METEGEDSAEPSTSAMLLQAMQTVQQLTQTLASPKQFIKDETGRIVGVSHVQ